MIKSVDKITVERVFNIGNYQTIRFGMEVSTEDLTNQEAVTDAYNRCLYAVETSFNDIMTERQKQEEQRMNREYERYVHGHVNEAKREMRKFTE